MSKRRYIQVQGLLPEGNHLKEVRFIARLLKNWERKGKKWQSISANVNEAKIKYRK